MDLRKIKKLIDLVEESGIAEIEITEGEESVRISRQQTTYVGPQPPVQYQIPVAGTPVASNIGSSNDGNAKENTNNAPEYKEEDLFKSPMVGVFYRAPSPNSSPFVEEGQKVNQGDTLCIIEAMKLMNEIEAEKSGTITKILIEDGEPVEYGEPLFIIS
ncbi:acetyl-CoA carboxylase biotin carboxyl carrier protein [Neisseriaceae bacterium PsAf]|nr:acetyl-CoA carboxylase biotin carboxyl carrier protein [Neisseriaceae bacterium PsAf]MCV2503750.1 acetyl-CoA carboxylase biotin carboxyl carrier protein [Neisseriaceae bacterium]